MAPINRLIRVALAIIALVLIENRAANAHYENATMAAPDRTVKPANSAGKTSRASLDVWKLLDLALSPAFAYVTNVSINVEGPSRIIRSNGIPDHPTGEFPNPGNPNQISEQQYTFRMPANPALAGRTTPVYMNLFGVALNGVPFDPGAAEWWNNDPFSGWQFEAMVLGPRLGLDENNAHVQPNGAYHYHGIPTGLLQRLSAARKPILLGYAADGFPIYGPYGPSDPMNAQSSMKVLKSSYRVRSGSRPSNGPAGNYDGTFIQDYEFVKGKGDLDDCNGRYGVTSEYPQGTYYYVLSDTYPYVPRGWKGAPDESFRKRPGQGRGLGRGGRGPGLPGGPGFGPPGGPGFGPPGRPGFGPPGGPGSGPPEGQ